MSKHAEDGLENNRARVVRRGHVSRVTAVVAVAGGLLAIGCNVAIGGGILVAGVVAGILTYDCAEGVGVTLWDRSTAHPVCDATVTAEREGKSVTFSPCYNAFLGEGTWTVSATKDGYQRAQGSVIIPHGHSCSEPTYHSVELTLLRNDEGARATELTPPSPPAAPPPAMAPQAVAPQGTPPMTTPPSQKAPPTVGPLPLQGRPSSGTETPSGTAPPPITGAPLGPASPSPAAPEPSQRPGPDTAPPSAAFPLPAKSH